MPTDWPITETDLVRRIKTKFNGNPRYVEIADNFVKNSGEPEAVGSMPNVYYNDESGVEGGEEDYNHSNHAKYVKPIKSVNLDDIVSTVSETEETVETVPIQI